MARERLVFVGYLQSLLNRSLPKVSLALVVLYLNPLISWVQEASATQPESEPVGQRELENWELDYSPGINSRLRRPSNLDEISQITDEARHLYENGHILLAAKTWQQAINLYRTKGNTLDEALALSNLALAYQQLGQQGKASSVIAQSLKLAHKVEALPENSGIIAQILTNQGSFQLACGQTEQALSSWEKATPLYKIAGDRFGMTWSLLNSSAALQALGFYRRAVESLNSVSRELESTPSSPLKAIALRNLGNALRGSGELARSRQVLQQSLKLAQEIGLPSEIDATLLGLGNTARKQQDKTAAWKFYKQASSGSGFASTQAKLNQLSLLIEYKAFDTAASLAAQIAPEISDLPAKRSSIYATINFAQNLKILQAKSDRVPSQLETAKLLAGALEQAKNLQDPTAEAYTLGCLGSLYEQNQQFLEAKKLTQQALMLAQSIRSPDVDYRFSWQLGRILKAQGDISGAIASYTQSTNALKALRGDLVAVNPTSQYDFRDQVEPVYRQLTELLLLSKQPSQKNLIQARETIEALQLEELNNFFQTACLDNPIKIDQAVDHDDPKAAVIYPIILPDRLEIIVKLPGLPLQNYKANIRQVNLEKLIQELRNNLTRPYTLQNVHLLSRQLYDWVIEPARESLTKSKVETLVFVLDGSLRNIPMAALYDGQQYLIQKYAIALNPALNLLPPESIKKIKLKALTAGLTQPRHGESPLGNVSLEFNQIKSEVPSTILLNQQFTTASLQHQIESKSFPIVHLATHAQFSSEAAKTYILAWDKPIFVKDLDLLLRSNDSQHEAIELLILSGCQTAKGDRRAALGLAGVAVRAGARSTLATSWATYDDSSALFMSEFYKQLAQNKLNKAQALRQTQLFFINNSDYPLPIFWASYVLLGNWL